jgi:hypothetical protein
LLYSVAADLAASLHLAFVAFVVLGGFLVLRWPRSAWVHLPAVVWGVSIEFMGWICPLTPLENRLRHEAGLAGYEGGFVEHYLIPVLYPGSLTRSAQIVLGLSVLLINATLYGWMLRRRARHPL